MASPRHLPAATPGNKENIPDGGAATISDCPELCKEGAFSPKPKKKPAGFNLRKSIAWNPAFFTEQGVLDNSELSMLTGSQLKANGSPRSGAMSPFCRSGRSASACVLKGVAENSHGKLSAKHCSAEKQGRKLFSSAKTPQRDQRRESAESQNRSSSRSIKKCIPRVPSGSIQKKVPNSSSTAQMSGIPKKSEPSLPTVPRTTSPLTTVLKSNIKLGPVKAEQVHRVPGLPPKSKISSVSSGSRTVKDVVPAVTPTHEEASGSLKCKNFLPHPQISPSSYFGGPASTFAKPSALRMPSPSVGFFTQENAHAPHANAAKRNVGSCFVGNTSSVIKPPRYKQPEDLKSGVHLTKPLSTNCIAASNPLVLPVIGKSSPNALVGNTSSVIKPPRYKQPEDLKSGVHLTKPVSTNCIAASNPLVLPVVGKSSPNALVAPDKESSLKNITCSAKSVNANNQEIPDASCLLAGNGATIQPPILAKNDAARNSLPDVYSDTPHIERRNPFENSYPLKAVCPSTIEPAEDTSLEFTCSSTKSSSGGTLLPSSISSQECSSSDLTYQSKPESSSSEAIYLSNSHVAETTLAISLSEGESCTPALDFLQGFDSHDHQNTECATLMESVESIICADQAPCFGSSKGETPALADCHSDFGDSLCNENKPASSEEVNTVGGVELEINNGSSVKETPSLHVVCQNNHNYRRTEPSPMILEAPMLCAESQDALSVEPNMEDKMVLDTDKLSAVEGASRIVNIKAPDRSWTNGNLKDQLKDLVPFTEEWLAVMEARGQEVLEQKTGAVQNSPPDKTAPEPSPWSPVKRKAQDVGPFDCTKYSKSVRTCGTP